MQVVSAMDALTFVNFWILNLSWGYDYWLTSTTTHPKIVGVQEVQVPLGNSQLIHVCWNFWKKFTTQFFLTLPKTCSMYQKNIVSFTTSTTPKMFHSRGKKMVHEKKLWDMLRSSPTTAHTGQKLHLLHHLFRNLKASIFDFGHGIPGASLGLTVSHPGIRHWRPCKCRSCYTLSENPERSPCHPPGKKPSQQVGSTPPMYIRPMFQRKNIPIIPVNSSTHFLY